MAGEDINKKVLLEIDLAQDAAQEAMQKLATDTKAAAEQIKNLKAAIVVAKAATADANAEYAKERNATQAARTEYQKKRTAIMEANQALKQSKQATQTAAGSYDEAQKKLTALGRAIKSAEGGFESSNPAIRAQVTEYRKLNDQLKAFDAKLGNHQRNVGNYSSVLSGLNGTIGRLIPGFSQFSGMIQSATQSFNGLKGATVEAEAGTGALSGTVIGLVAAIAGAILVITAYAKALASLTPNAERIQRTFSGIGNVWRQMVADFDDEKLSDNFDDFKRKWGEFFSKMAGAYKDGAALKGQFQDLARSANTLSVNTAEADAKIADLQLKMRNRRITPEQEKAYFDQIQAIANNSYTQRKAVADAEYELSVKAAVQGRNFTDQEIQMLREKGSAYAAYLDKIKGLANKEGAGTDIQAIAKAQQDQIAAERFKETTEDRAQNRLDAKMMKADEAKARAEQELITAQEAFKKAQSDRVASVTRTVELTQAANGKELSQLQEHFRQLIFEQNKFIDDQEKLRAKTKSQRVKDQVGRNIIQARGNISQLGVEGQTAVAEKMRQQAEAMFDLLQKSANDLAQAEIANIEQVEKQQLAALSHRRDMEKDAYEKERTDRQLEIDRLHAQYAKAHGAEKDSLGRSIQELEQIQRNAHKRDLAEEAKYQEDRADLIKAYNDRQTQLLDQAAVIRAQQAAKKSGNDEPEYQAKQKQLLDEYNAEVSNEKLTEAEKLLLEQQYLAASSDLKDQYRQKELQKAIQWEQLVQNTATSIIRNAIASNYEYTVSTMERQKTWELNNTALTNTQKQAIDEKYRVQEGKAKQKEFKQEQALKIAEAVMAGARAVVEDLWNPTKIPFDIATTAAEVATIAAQKPPAYATGGVHVGDGAVKGPGTGTSDSINARLSNGESVINAKSTSFFAPLLSAINQWGGGVSFSSSSTGRTAFATGGIAGTYLPTADNGLRPSISVSSRLHSEDMQALGVVFSNAVASLPRPITDVKDISYQQDMISTVSNLARY